jgi:predicted permease
MQILLLVAPVFAIIVTGFLAVRANIVDDAITGWLITFAYKICLPALMITIVADAKFSELLNWGFWIAFGGATLMVLCLVLVAGRGWLGHDRSTLTIAALSAAMTNAGFVALPILHHVFGAKGVPPAAIANLIIAAVMFPLAVVLMELARGSAGERRSVMGIAWQVISNPMVWSTLLGFALAAGQVSLPGVVDDFLLTLGQGLTPAALFAVGASIRLGDLVHDAGRLAVLTTLKLVVLPAIALGLALLLDLAPIWAVAATICAAVPTAKNVVVLAQQFDRGKAVASMAISATTMFSIGTLTLWFLLLAQLFPSAFAHLGS